MKVLRFGIVGDFQSGKSTLVNCLLGRPIAAIGDGTPTTHAVVNYLYEGQEERLEYLDKTGTICKSDICELDQLEKSRQFDQVNVFLSAPILRDFILTDMPGFGNDEEDNSLAEVTIKKIDFAIVLTRNEKSGEEESNLYKNVLRLRKHRIPYYLIMNCTDFNKWSPSHPNNFPISERNRSLFSSYPPISYPFENREIPIVNLMWYWFSICSHDDPIIKRYKSMYNYITSRVTIQDIKSISNFYLITKIFSMENRAFLELRKTIKEEIQELKKELCPIGTIQAFAFDKIPNGWLPCNGELIDINLYPELYAAIGITFGGDGKSNFRLPDLRDKFVRGWGMDKTARKFGTFQDDALQGHSHKFVEKNLTIDKSGGHTHLFRPEYGNTGNPKLFSDNDRVEKFSNVHDKLFSYHTSYNGDHTHNLKVTNNPISNPEPSTYGSVRIAKETRPQNLALLYCIRAE